MFPSLKGNRTFILAAVAALSALANFLFGDASLIETVQWLATSGAAATLRSALKGMEP